MADKVPTGTGPPHPTAPPLPHAPPDWPQLARIADHNIRHVLPGSSDELVEDLRQEALVRLMRALRHAEARNLEALTTEIARRTAIDHLRSRRRWEALVEPWSEETGELADAMAPDPAEMGDPLERVRFGVMAFFESGQSECLELARAYFRELDWLTVAAACGRSPEAVRKQWSRCVAALRAAVRTDPDRLWRWARGAPRGGVDANR